MMAMLANARARNASPPDLEDVEKRTLIDTVFQRIPTPVQPVRCPASVPGPFGKPLTLDMLPPPETRRWVVRRKAEVMAAVNGGLLSAAEACARYRLSPEELELWQKAIDRAGVPGLRVTRIQLYRDDYGRHCGKRPSVRAADGARQDARAG